MAKLKQMKEDINFDHPTRCFYDKDVTFVLSDDTKVTCDCCVIFEDGSFVDYSKSFFRRVPFDIKKTDLLVDPSGNTHLSDCVFDYIGGLFWDGRKYELKTILI